MDTLGFIFLALTLLCGIAAQGVGLVVGCFLWPLCFLKKVPLEAPTQLASTHQEDWKQNNDQAALNPVEIGSLLQQAGAALMGLFLMFPLWNILAMLLNPSPRMMICLASAKGSGLKLLLESQLSAATLSSSLWLLAVGGYVRFKPWRFHDTEKIWQVFQKSLMWFSAVFFLYLLIQHTTGLRLEAANLGHEKILQNGTYRVLGFYGHPLSLATVSLFLLVFFSFLWTKLQENKALLLAVLQLLCLFLSGGRTAMIIGIATLCSVFYVMKSPHKLKLLPFVIAGSGGLLVWFWGSFLRFKELVVAGGFFEERFYFWQIYFDLIKERPWMGHGSYWLALLRADKYLALGETSKHYNAHNIFLELLATLGLIGTAIFMGLFGLLAYKSRLLATPAKLSAMWVALWSAFLANLLHGLTQNTLFDSNYFHVFLMLLMLLFIRSLGERVSPRL